MVSAIQHLHILHGNNAPAYVICGYKPTDGRRFQNRAHLSLDNAAREIERLAPEMEAYATTSTFIDRRRLKDNIAKCGWVGLDRDDLPLSPALPEPTMTIQTSPERYQDFWHLGTPTDAATMERLQRTIAAVNGNGNAAIDPGRLWRIPGTPNHKRGGVMVELSEYRPERVYNPHDFDHLLTVPASPATETEALTGTVDGLVIWQRVKPLLSAHMVALAEGEAVSKQDGTLYATPSEGDQALFTALSQVGLTDTELEAAFVVTARGRDMITRHGKDARRRIRLGIRTARAFIADNPATTNLTRSHIRLDAEIYDHFAPLLGGIGLSVYMALLRRDNPGNQCFPSQERIATELGISRKKVNEEIAKIARLGLVRIEKKPGTRSNNYIIVHPEELDFT